MHSHLRSEISFLTLLSHLLSKILTLSSHFTLISLWNLNPKPPFSSSLSVSLSHLRGSDFLVAFAFRFQCQTLNSNPLRFRFLFLMKVNSFLLHFNTMHVYFLCELFNFVLFCSIRFLCCSIFEKIKLIVVRFLSSPSNFVLFCSIRFLCCSNFYNFYFRNPNFWNWILISLILIRNPKL